MEMNTIYDVNIISQIDVDRGIFVAVEQFNYNSTEYFLYYYKQLLELNSCGDWYQHFDYPTVETGRAVIVQDGNKKSQWSRGIISKCPLDNFFPEVYLIDSQRFTDKDSRLELRKCPPKFLQLKLPTYYIDINLSLDNDDLKTAINILINKSQYGEISFNFIPQSVKNNVYSGVLIVNSKINSLDIPLKKLLKNTNNNFFFKDLSQFKKQQFSIFNPIEFKYLKNIFLPMEKSNTLFLDRDLVSSYCNLSILDDSTMNLSYNSDEYSSTSNYSDNIGFNDDSELENHKLQDTCITPIAKQNIYSTYNTPMSMSNSSLQSVNSYSSNCTVQDGCQQNKSTLTSKILETPEIHLESINNTQVQSVNTKILNSDILWWSDDEEN